MHSEKGNSRPERKSRPAGPGRLPDCLLGGGIDEDNTGSIGLQQGRGHFVTQRGAALALLASDARLTRKAGSFLGQLVVDPTPLTHAQRDWIDTLLERAGLPSLAGEAEA